MNMSGQKAIKGKNKAYAKYKTQDREDRTEKIIVEKLKIMGMMQNYLSLFG